MLTAAATHFLSPQGGASQRWALPQQVLPLCSIEQVPPLPWLARPRLDSLNMNPPLALINRWTSPLHLGQLVIGSSFIV